MTILSAAHILCHPPLDYAPGITVRGQVDDLVAEALVDTSLEVSPQQLELPQGCRPRLSSLLMAIIITIPLAFHPGVTMEYEARVAEYCPLPHLGPCRCPLCVWSLERCTERTTFCRPSTEASCCSHLSRGLFG